MNKRKKETMSIGEEAAERAWSANIIQNGGQSPLASIIDRIVAERGIMSGSKHWKQIAADKILEEADRAVMRGDQPVSSKRIVQIIDSVITEPAGASLPQELPNAETGEVLAAVITECADFIEKHLTFTPSGDLWYRRNDILDNARRVVNLIRCGKLETLVLPVRSAQQTPADSVREPKSVLVEKTKEAIKRLKRWIVEGNPCTEVNDDILTVCNFAEEEKENE